MKRPLTILRDDPDSIPTKEKEIKCFVRAIQSQVGRVAIETLAGGIIPERYLIHHNTNPDDPPDIVAFNLGFEHTEFPPDQSATQKVYEEHSHEGMTIPPYSHGKGNVREIRKIVERSFVEPLFTSVADNISALEQAFLENVLKPGGKDVPGNDVLLLDARLEPWTEQPTEAARRALTKMKPRHLKLILYIYWTRNEAGKPSVPAAIQLYPK
jgi:hypothetical protein